MFYTYKEKKAWSSDSHITHPTLVLYNMSITSIENFSNEFFYEIFDYLNGCDIYQAFTNLNNRFQQLINSSSLLFKIKIDYPSKDDKLVNEFSLLNKNQIFSLSIWTWINTTEMILSLNLDSSYQRLERLAFRFIERYIVNLIVPKLNDLPRLFSLTINTDYDVEDYDNIYRFIFNLPKLKYFKCEGMDSKDFEINTSLPIASNEQFSPIEHFTIDHACTFEQFVKLISYTPQVNHLKCLDLNDNQINLNFPSSMRLTNLTHLSIEAYHITFDTFEIFFNQLNLKLKMFSFKTHVEDNNYLDANRWEQIISRKLPQLEEFYLKYIVHFQDDDQPPIYSGKPNEFLSSFWLERQWAFTIKIEDESIFYSIQPYKKRWYEYYTHDTMIYSFEQLAKSRQLIIGYVSEKISNQALIFHDCIDQILPVMQIDHLHIKDEIFLVTLDEILCLLPELDSLKIHPVEYSHPKPVTDEDLLTIYYPRNKTKITKVCLIKICRTEEVYFLFALCPLIEQLQIDCLYNIDIELFLRSFLMEIKSRSIETLRLLCFRVPTIDDDMIHKLQNMIQSENLLLDFTIKRVMDKIYVQWK
ncbi:unnamed protein product [Adineta steineri]|uniref:F-box domain-containing protein n=1 Tax=Adineta steineri TaxID=433720 RepID=A0A814JTK4_9BILA|nr:unnamed protein product [Adineta steineri]CAF3751783.1 unnamed protein product [Adineta steineri]